MTGPRSNAPRDVILRALRNHGPQTTAQVVYRTGLPYSRVAQILCRLSAEPPPGKRRLVRVAGWDDTPMGDEIPRLKAKYGLGHRADAPRPSGVTLRRASWRRYAAKRNAPAPTVLITLPALPYSVFTSL